ncbi:hypothetical protein B0H13DRAFT_1872702 [Mycena leptocephala]|nr:hypothetical protein B0H13DRAFT_1872702 [Mycena leptocephala]
MLVPIVVYNNMFYFASLLLLPKRKFLTASATGTLRCACSLTKRDVTRAYSSKRRGDRTKCSFDLEDVREATHCGGGGGIGAKKNKLRGARPFSADLRIFWRVTLRLGESIWEFEIPEYRSTGGVIEIVIWEMPINGTTWAPDASRNQQGLNKLPREYWTEFNGGFDAGDSILV